MRPMGLCIDGRAYRNEISPRQGAYRMREFIQAELQIFFDPATVGDAVPFQDIASVPVRVAWASEKHAPTAHDAPARDLVGHGLPPWYVYHLVQVQRFYLDLLRTPRDAFRFAELRSEEHTSELQSHSDLVCRLLLE